MANPLPCSRDNEQEIAVAQQLIIHYCKVEPTASDKHREDALGRWRPAVAGNRGELRAVAYAVARHLRNRLGVPVGILQSARSNTPVVPYGSIRRPTPTARLYSSRVLEWPFRCKCATRGPLPLRTSFISREGFPASPFRTMR